MTSKETLLHLLHVYIWNEANELATLDDLEKLYCQVAHIRMLLDDIPKMRVALDVIIL
ncbi:MAG: hypothetical protein HY738_11470 [Bacteroidia bacterium]|nr:hypothetical protein [Bacteroidia bacterium]